MFAHYFNGYIVDSIFSIKKRMFLSAIIKLFTSVNGEKCNIASHKYEDAEKL